MPTLEWSTELSLNVPAMDAVHQEFVDMLNSMASTSDAQVCPQWAEVIRHTQSHFDAEDQWMEKTGFGSANCHSSEHHVILQIMREGERRGLAGELALVRQLADELCTWFSQHAQSMDLALAQHIRAVGFDPLTGDIAHPEALPQAAISSCGTACHSGADAAPQVADSVSA